MTSFSNQELLKINCVKCREQIEIVGYRYVTVSDNSVDLVDFYEEKLGIAIAMLKNDDYLKQRALVL